MKKINWPLVIVLFLVVLGGTVQAIIPSRYYVKGLMTYFVKTDTSLAVNVDTANAITRNYIKRIADSVAANRAGNDYMMYRLYGVLPNNASDSVNLQVGVNGVYEGILPNFQVYAFNFALLSTTPSNIVSSFRNDLLPMTNDDSLYFFRVSRNVSMTDTCAITIYKLPVSAGPDINDKTVGTFYDMVRFSGIKLPAGANRFFTVDVALKRKI